METELGLSTSEAFSRLCSTLESEIAKERERLSVGRFALRECALLHITASILFLAITLGNIYLSSRVYHMQRFAAVNKATNILNSLKLASQEEYDYEHLCAPNSDAISLQYTYRDQKLRAGQLAPSRCISEQGEFIDLGDMPQYPQMICPETHGVIPLKSTKWKVVESPLVEHIRIAFDSSQKRRSNLLNSEITTTLHFSLERCLFPVLFVLLFGMFCFRNLGFVLGERCKLPHFVPNSNAVSNRIFVEKVEKRERYKGSLLPFGISSIASSCALNSAYSSFLDHISAVSKTVPNTLRDWIYRKTEVLQS
ncbi:unnamed protein product [Gongylonema pulchrum]|uniref:Transmembrane protein n=1 Tax=Gongylonema pulchrum TaxID=637853 RepID=A0A183DS90_9BILA|nr:unnamed protein product [Gongylonema pulchrum]